MKIEETEFHNFEQKAYNVKLKNNIFICFCIYIYSIFGSNMFDFVQAIVTHQKLETTEIVPKLFEYTGIALFIYVTLQIVAGTIIHHFYTKDLSSEISIEREKIEDPDFVNDEDAKIIRTILVKKISRYPFQCTLRTLIIFVSGCLACSFPLIKLFELNEARSIFLIFTMMCCAINGSVSTFNQIEHLCSIYAEEMVSYGISERLVKEQKFWGMNIYVRIVLYVIIPTLMHFISAVLFMWTGFQEKMDEKVQFIYLLCVVGINLSMMILISFFFKSYCSRYTLKMNSLLKQFTKKSLLKVKTIPVTFTTESDYSIHLINNIISGIQNLNSESINSIDNILYTTQELLISSETSSESAEKKQVEIELYLGLIKTSLDNLDATTKKINDVCVSSLRTKNKVDEGNEILKRNVEKIKEIRTYNNRTVKEINDLSKEIDSIFEIIASIKSISEKTKVIAFNAELEISSAGESGEKFHTITNEIRRLASSITDSIHEINEKLMLIQESSDNLIISSEAGTLKIEEGNHYIENLQESFEELCISSDITAESTINVSSTIGLQTSAFTEIEDNLNEIRKGFDFFSKSYAKVFDTTKEINEISKSLILRTKED